MGHADVLPGVTLTKAKKKKKEEKQPPPKRVQQYPSTWTKRPGDPGFTAYAEGLLKAAKLSTVLQCDRSGGGPPKDQWYQSVLRWMMHPHTPITRLLVAWQLGSGKTIGMLIVLSNYFNDPRPKVVVVPTEDLVTNFYRALLTTDNPYRRWLATVDPNLKNDNVSRAQQLLERAQTGPNAMPGPLRAFRYTIAGGRTFSKSPILTRGSADVRRDRTVCPLSHCIVVCDEAHNLLHPPATFNRLQINNTKRFATRIEQAENAVIALFTATPIVQSAQDADELLRMVKGPGPANRTDEGFVS